MKLAHLALVGAATLLFLSGCATSSDIRPPDVPNISTADLEAQAALDLDRARSQYLGQFPDVEVPVVQRVRFIALNGWADVMAECLRAAGFDATSTPDGGLQAGPPVGQEIPFGLAGYTCSAQYPIDPRENLPLNEDQIRYLYEYYVQVATPCLEALGFTNLPEPPSQQSYIGSYPTGPSWDIYSTVAEQADEEEWYEANAKCPQRPTDIVGEPLD